jgi:hypothetical protein
MVLYGEFRQAGLWSATAGLQARPAEAAQDEL